MLCLKYLFPQDQYSYETDKLRGQAYDYNIQKMSGYRLVSLEWERLIMRLDFFQVNVLNVRSFIHTKNGIQLSGKNIYSESIHPDDYSLEKTMIYRLNTQVNRVLGTE